MPATMAGAGADAGAEFEFEGALADQQGEVWAIIKTKRF